MKKIEKYVANQVLTASPAELVLLLLDEGIRSLKKAEAAFATVTPEQLSTIHDSLLHAQDVIQELSLSLNLEKGGDVANNLDRIYSFMRRHLIQANMEKNRQPVVEVRELLTTLREAWLHVVEKEQEIKDVAPRPSLPTHRILAAG